MNIKQKVMKAWAEEMVVEVVPKVGTFQGPGEGEVLFVSEGKTFFAIWSPEARSRLEYRFEDIAGIRFVGEAEEERKEGPGVGGLIYNFSPDGVCETVFGWSGKCQHADRCNQGNVTPEPPASDITSERWRVCVALTAFLHCMPTLSRLQP